LTISNSFPLVEVAVGDARGRFLLDTGAGISLVRQTAVDKFRLRMIDGGAHGLIGSGGEAVTKAAVLKDASIGGLKIPELNLPVPADTAFALPSDVLGIVGMDFLGKFDVDFDAPAKRMRLYTGSPCSGEALPIGSNLPNIRGLWVRQLTANDLDRRMYIRGSLNGQDIVALLDTGAQRSVLYADMASQLGVTAAMLAADPTLPIRGVGAGSNQARRHKVAELHFGNGTLRDLEIWVLPRAYTNDASMTVGWDWISQNRIWFSTRRHVAYAAPAR
jgi:predicted aspartyl protease